MSWPEYSDRKESGVAWLGEVPAHWNVTTLRRITRLAYGDALASEDREDGEVPVYGSNGCVGFHRVGNTLGPCIVVGRKGSFGKINFSETPAFAIDTTYFIDGRSTNADLKWLAALLISLRLDAISKDSAVPGLAREDVYPLAVGVPPPDEQVQIANFLDRETAKIDALIAKKRELIERLKEKRTALISHVVTKGLPPEEAAKHSLPINPPLKPSGTYLFDTIPEHWAIKQLRYVGNLQSGDSITTEEMIQGGDYPVYGGNGIRGWYHEFNRDGDFVLIGRQGALCGNINRASGKFFASEHAVVVACQRQTCVAWLGFILESMNLGQFSQSAAQPGLAVEFLKGLTIPVPPFDEQKVIADFLSVESLQMKAVAEKLSDAIEKLQEYRSALITAAVTGKIDVRKEATS